MLEQMEKLLDEKVRPYLREHFGEVELISFEEGVLRLRLLGECSQCPSAQITAEEVIGKELKAAFPEIADVVLVQQVREELLDFARQILNRSQGKP